MLQQFYPQTPHSFRYELNKDMQFSAAHYVPHPSAGLCQEMHGHTYFVNITIAGDQLDEAGFLINFKDVKALVHKRYDHTVLNNAPEFSAVEGDGLPIPSTEGLAEHVYNTIQEHLNKLPNKPVCISVMVRETPTSYVVYRAPKEILYADGQPYTFAKSTGKGHGGYYNGEE